MALGRSQCPAKIIAFRYIAGRILGPHQFMRTMPIGIGRYQTAIPGAILNASEQRLPKAKIGMGASQVHQGSFSVAPEGFRQSEAHNLIRMHRTYSNQEWRTTLVARMQNNFPDNRSKAECYSISLLMVI